MVNDRKNLAGYHTEITRTLKHRDWFGSLLNGHGLLGTGVEVGVQRGYFSKTILEK